MSSGPTGERACAWILMRARQWPPPESRRQGRPAGRESCRPRRTPPDQRRGPGGRHLDADGGRRGHPDAKSVDAAMASEAQGLAADQKTYYLAAIAADATQAHSLAEAGQTQDRAYADATGPRESRLAGVAALQTVLVNADAAAVGNVAGLYKTYVIAVDAANCTLAKAMAADAQTAANEFATAHQAATIKLTRYGVNPPSTAPPPSSATTASNPTARTAAPGLLRPACWTAWPRTSRATPM